MPAPAMKRFSHTIRRLAICATLVLLAATPGLVQAEVTKEYQVKAAFLYNFTKFVEWPPARFADAQRPIVIGIVGRNPFGDELAKITGGRKINGRDIVIRLVASEAEVLSADLIFVSVGEEEHLPDLTGTLQQAGILTVGESPRFAAAGGMITFVLERDKIRFQINQAASEQAGLKINAQLLKLAITVQRKS